MRVLFTAWAWPSHLYPMVPLAWACRAAGHEVRVAAPPGVRDTIVRAGLVPVTVGRDGDALEAVRGFVLGRTGARGGPAKPSARTPRALGMFVDLAEAMVDDLVAWTRDRRPDLIVHDPTAWAGPLAAAAAGVPAVRLLYGVDLLFPARDAVAEALGPLRDRLGIGPVDPLGDLTIDPCPPGLQALFPVPRLRMRYLPYNGFHDGPYGTEPAVRSPSTGRPRICVTWGTTMARLDQRLFLAGRVARAVAGLGAEVVVAVTAAQRAALGPVPDGVRIAESVPLQLLVPGFDLLIHHGGAGSMLTGLAHGLPQLVLPQLPDHAGHARRLVASGAGVALDAADGFEPEAISTAAGELLESAQYAHAAGELRAQMAASPTPAALVADLVEMARSIPDGAASSGRRPTLQ